MNFTYTLTTTQDGTFGRLSKDGTWNGMVRLLQDGDVDIGLLVCFLSASASCAQRRENLEVWLLGRNVEIEVCQFHQGLFSILNSVKVFFT